MCVCVCTVCPQRQNHEGGGGKKRRSYSACGIISRLGNLIFSRHIEVHSLPADSDHYSLSVTTRHADYVAKSLLLIRLRSCPAERSKEERTARREERGSGVLRKRLKTSSSLECR